MGSGRTSTLGLLLLAAVALSVAPLAFVPLLRYGVVLRLEGERFAIDGRELCRDVVGSVIVKFGAEFHSIDLCELLRRGEVWVDFDEGVRYWVERLERIIYKWMDGKDVLWALWGRGGVAMPTVSVTFWLVAEDLHYIANYAYTSLDYYMSRGYDYTSAFYRMLRDPLAIVRERTVIVVRSEELIGGLVRVNMTRVLEWVRERLSAGNLTGARPGGSYGPPAVAPSPHPQQDAQATCPPGTSRYDSGICAWENYWGLPREPPGWFAGRLRVGRGLDRGLVSREVWGRFVEVYSTAYLLDKGMYRDVEAVWAELTGRLARNPCRERRSLGVPVDMGFVVGECLRSDNVSRDDLGWAHTRPRGSEFTLYKPLVLRVVSLTGRYPPLYLYLKYETALGRLKRTGLSLLGVALYGTSAYSMRGERVEGVIGTPIDVSTVTLSFGPHDWDRGRRVMAIVVPSTMEYLYDAVLFYWNIGTYRYGEREYWLAEPVPIVLPYYEEVSWEYNLKWDSSYYNESGKCEPYTCSYAGSLEELSRLLDIAYRSLPRSRVLVASLQHGSVPRDPTTVDSLGTPGSARRPVASLVFGIARELVECLLGREPGLFAELLKLLEFADAALGDDGVRLELAWAGADPPEDVRVHVYKEVKSGEYLSDELLARGYQPLAGGYVVVIGAGTPGGAVT